MESNNSMYSPESQPQIPQKEPELEPVSLENLEDKQEALFEKLITLFKCANKEEEERLRFEWESKVAEMTTEDAITELEKVIEERAKALSLMKFRDTLVLQISDKELIKEIQDTLSDFESLRHNESYFLGSGKFAKVYMDQKSSKVAVKYLYNDGLYKTQKKLIENECDLMEKLFDFRVGGLRIPYIFKKNGEMDNSEEEFYNRTYTHYLVMERIHGFSLRDIVETKKAGEEFVALLKSIDEKVLHEKLTEFLQEMHEVKKIVHGDIHAGNIMIDGDGNIFLIDFGKGKKTDTVSSDNEAITDKMEADEKLAYEGTTTMGESKKREFEELTKTLQAVYQTLLTM